MFKLFGSDPIKKLEKEHSQVFEKAFQAQRNGNIRLYSELSAKADAIQQKIEKLKAGH